MSLRFRPEISRSAALKNGAGLTYAAPNGAGLSCVRGLRGSRLHFRARA